MGAIIRPEQGDGSKHPKLDVFGKKKERLG
jgi:hypothetical protein